MLGEMAYPRVDDGFDLDFAFVRDRFCRSFRGPRLLMMTWSRGTEFPQEPIIIIIVDGEIVTECL